MTFNIQLKEIKDVYSLVNILIGFEGEVDLESGRYKVDGKSILGIFSLFTKRITFLQSRNNIFHHWSYVQYNCK